MPKSTTDDRGPERCGLGKDLLRSIWLSDRLEPRCRWKDDLESGGEFHRSQPFGGLDGTQGERTPAVSQAGGSSKRAKAPAADPERNVFLHGTGINDETLEIVKLTVVSGL